ncbi:hypothetical protein DBR33_02140 [Stenotrophomonas sp. HMWF022]|uniref:hypothetical protein n=1 Tax=Stenotrophomonas sp. HMWF023 TaxID=2056859 RepID=UPI000D33E515|nr:hypothetical protein [Stenotrophomonas sp. HMWF023]PTS76445.1 hypothetical protein DBR20_09905 [Stenotrophomonas sp. HMWF023]PTT56756.1 hypothetical protein DBR33_02140 [Stenotrophomonas sp. HMWF022]
MTVATDVNAASPLNSMEKNMKTIARIDKTPIAVSRLRSTAMAISLAAMLSFPVKGYTIPVVEVGLNTVNSTLTEFNTLTSQAQAFAEYGTQAQRFIDTTQNWAQKLAKYNQIIASPLMPRGVTLKPVPLEWNVAERCGAGSIMSLSGILTALDLSPGGDIISQQRNICASIQVLENQKYNETVEVVQKTMPDMRAVLDKIKDIRDLWSGEGAMAEASANAVVSDAYMQADFATWEKKTEGYDRQIQALTKMQQILAQRALKGTGQSPLGTVVKAAALKAALSN